MARKTGSLLKELRELMKKSPASPSGLQAFVIPTGDNHQNEYSAECDKHRQFISGFTGSCGTAVVTQQKALLWTDGRYFSQAVQQLDPENWQLMKDGLPETPDIPAFLSKELPPNSTIGIDASTYNNDRYTALCKGVKNAGQKVVCVEENLVSKIWTNRPTPPAEPAVPQESCYTGKTCYEKVSEIRQKLSDSGCAGLAVTALDEVAWLFNLRGSDIDFNPVFFAYAFVTQKEVVLFIDGSKLSESTHRHLAAETSVDGLSCLVVKEYAQFLVHLNSFVTANPESRILVSTSSSQHVANAIPTENILLGKSPIALMKSVKNSVELEGIRDASIRDAVALCQYFSWLEQEVPKGGVTELSGSEKLLQLRRNVAKFVGPSFDTISGSGPNGAVIHYRSTEETNRPLTVNEMYLCDSGGQYKDGTTDVTRTMHYGEASAHEKECYTRVLKGHINLAQVIFPTNCRGALLDCLSRTALWQVGLDFNHGTGHGVGAYLNVHEGPQAISPRALTDAGLQAGMLVTDEPGYYEDGAFGIRIENVCLVTKAETKYRFNDKDFLTLEPMTLVPYESGLLTNELLTAPEIDYVNNYHTQCREKLIPLLEQQGDASTLKWLMRKTQLIG